MAYQDFYYKTGFGGVVPIVSQADYDKVVAAGFSPFKQTAGASNQTGGTNAPTTTNVQTPVVQNTTTTPSVTTSYRPELNLNQTQVSELDNLIKNKPFSQWTQMDVDNYNYATGSDLQLADFNIPQELNLPDGDKQFKGVDTLNQVGDEFLSGVDLTLENARNFINSQSPEQAELEEEGRGFTDRLLDRVKALTGRTDRARELEGQLDIAGMTQTLTDLNSQLAQTKAEYDNLIAAEGSRNIPKAFVTGRQNQLRQRAAVELGGLAAMVEAAQGNLETANNLIDKTIEREYQPILDEIDLIKTQLEINRDQLSRADQKRADLLNFLMDERNRRITTEMNTKKEIMSIASQAAANGASSSVVKSIMNATSEEEALTIATENNVVVKPRSIGGGGGGTTQANKDIVINDMNRILSEHVGEDGKVDTNLFKQLRDSVIREVERTGDTSLLNWFDKTYPAERYVNPDFVNYVMDEPSIQEKNLQEGMNNQQWAEWITNKWTNDELEAIAKESNFTTGGFLGIGKMGDSFAYMDWLLKQIAKAKAAGKDDAWIMQNLDKIGDF